MIDERYGICARCGGSGSVETTAEKPIARCPDCNGTGYPFLRRFSAVGRAGA